MEVGLGGRLDSTNIVRPEVCAITSISLDHVATLGDTVEKIAFEKAGIIKSGVPVVAAPNSGRGHGGYRARGRRAGRAAGARRERVVGLQAGLRPLGPVVRCRGPARHLPASHSAARRPPACQRRDRHSGGRISARPLRHTRGQHRERHSRRPAGPRASTSCPPTAARWWWTAPTIPTLWPGWQRRSGTSSNSIVLS